MFDVHCFAPGTQRPPQALPVQTKSHAVCMPHCPSAPHVCIAAPVAQRVSFGTQTPPQALSTQANSHVLFGPHSPSTHVCMRPPEVHCVLPLLHIPVQT